MLFKTLHSRHPLDPIVMPTINWPSESIIVYDQIQYQMRKVEKGFDQHPKVPIIMNHYSLLTTISTINHHLKIFLTCAYLSSNDALLMNNSNHSSPSTPQRPWWSLWQTIADNPYGNSLLLCGMGPAIAGCRWLMVMFKVILIISWYYVILIEMIWIAATLMLISDDMDGYKHMFWMVKLMVILLVIVGWWSLMLGYGWS